MQISVTDRLEATSHARFLDGFWAAPGPALAYHYPFYVSFLSQVAYPGSALRYVCAWDDEGNLAGLLVGLHLVRGDLKAWLSLPYFGPNAGALVPGEQPDLVRELVVRAERDARELGCLSMTLHAPLRASPGPYRAALGEADFELARTSQIATLSPDVQTSPWPSRVRHDIRRATTLGLSVRPVASSLDLDRLFEVYAANCSTVGIPMKPRHHLQRIFETAGEHAAFLVAERDAEIVAGLVCLFGGGVISYYLPCTSPEVRSLQPGLLLLDRAVTLGRGRRCTLLNFEASPERGTGVWAFKQRCGGIAAPFHVFVKLLSGNALVAYRALGEGAIREAAPNAFIVPFDALR